MQAQSAMTLLASARGTSSLFPICNEESANKTERLLPMLLKAIASKMNALAQDIRVVHAESIRRHLAQLRAVAKDAQAQVQTQLSAHAAAYNPRLATVAADITALAGMYDREFVVLLFLVREMHFAVDHETDLVDIDAVISRWRTLRLVDLVFESGIMEAARAC
ncbi:hypothetical protein HDU83_007757 [Entophlyctis luteolus]|nr:hypothetical protein HDU83_007757 [Entophlyctis luteolus]